MSSAQVTISRSLAGHRPRLKDPGHGRAWYLIYIQSRWCRSLLTSHQQVEGLWSKDPGHRRAQYLIYTQSRWCRSLLAGHQQVEGLQSKDPGHRRTCHLLPNSQALSTAACHQCSLWLLSVFFLRYACIVLASRGSLEPSGY